MASRIAGSDLHQSTTMPITVPPPCVATRTPRRSETMARRARSLTNHPPSTTWWLLSLPSLWPSMADVRLARLAKVLLLAKMCPLQTLVYIGKSDAQERSPRYHSVPWIRSLMLLLKSRRSSSPKGHLEGLTHQSR
ncbi:hypothetical protein ZWY2020_028366 [Hordeum vulgare]|nr:hypothetical protein ZWY2020_028366 [Hordeum vulgare]